MVGSCPGLTLVLSVLRVAGQDKPQLLFLSVVDVVIESRELIGGPKFPGPKFSDSSLGEANIIDRNFSRFQTAFWMGRRLAWQHANVGGVRVWQAGQSAYRYRSFGQGFLRVTGRPSRPPASPCAFGF